MDVGLPIEVRPGRGMTAVERLGCGGGSGERGRSRRGLVE